MSDLDHQIKLKGEEIFRRMEDVSSSSIFNKDWWYGRIMEWSMKNEQFKTQMFRFVDVLPALQSGGEVARHLKEYFAEGGDELPSVFNMGVGVGSLMPSLMAGAVRKNVTQMARMFITGKDVKEALPVIKKSRKNQLAFTVDILGEATLSEVEALEYQRRYLELIDLLAQDAQSWEEVPLIDRDDRGPLPKVNVSVKLTALYSQIKVAAWDESKAALKERLRPILLKGIEKGAFVNLDMEYYSVKNLTIEVFKELLMEPELRQYPHFGCVMQAYLRDSHADVQGLVAFAKERGTPFTVRLVKGAYWDSEVIEAQQKGWPIPVYTSKADSDVNFEECTDLLLENHPFIRLAVGSHNVRSIAMAMSKQEKLGIPKEAIEFQMLFGMAEPIKKTLVEMGYRVREYDPVGELIPGMAYLVRRLLENTSNESFLRNKFSDGKSHDELLANPRSQNSGEASTPFATPSPLGFENEALLDFTLSPHREGVKQALLKLRSQGQDLVPLWVAGQRIESERKLDSQNPSEPTEVLARICIADEDMAEKAIQAEKKAALPWKRKDPFERAALIDQLADKMQRDRYELIAKQVLECGKPWAEADGDVCEAIDFCRYYAIDMRRLARKQRVGHSPGEVSHYFYQGRGPTLVIAPWNFPLAILTGMVAAALVTGNPVIIKPAEQSSWVASDLVRLLNELNLPEGVVSFLPGIGEEVGPYMVSHPEIATIAFTGSKAVGLSILQAAGKVQAGQISVKRAITEMGGKNALIIDADADLDEAVAGAIYSAFGFAGQKCSAASRIIVLDEVYDRFVERLVEAARSIKTLSAENPEAFLGPVIDLEAQQRIQGVIEEGKKQHTLLFQGEVPVQGYFVPPTLFGDVPPDAPLAQQEIFGPVAVLIRAKDLDTAITIANSTEYALTGGIYSRSPGNIEKVKRELEVGNMYINRSITGALVDRHPFGGYRMSGIGSKTGGPDYLKQYMEPRVITENTLRRGFAPMEET